MTQTHPTPLTPDIETTLTTPDGVSLHYYAWRPTSRPVGIVLLVHGYGEHLGRYAELARWLNTAGFVVGGCDHRGMGRSDGARGYIPDFTHYVEDLAVPAARLRQEEQDALPCFVYGHSMGGLIALRHAQLKNTEPFAGTILSGPLLGVEMPIPGWQVTLGRAFVRSFPKFRVPVPFNPTMLTHDLDEQAAVANDPLGLKHTTLGWFFASGAAMEAAHRDVERLAWPTLWLIPGEDKLCSAATSRAVHTRLSRAELHIWREYPGLFHELHKERRSDRERVFADLVEWLTARCASG